MDTNQAMVSALEIAGSSTFDIFHGYFDFERYLADQTEIDREKICFRAMVDCARNGRLPSADAFAQKSGDRDGLWLKLLYLHSAAVYIRTVVQFVDLRSLSAHPDYAKTVSMLSNWHPDLVPTPKAADAAAGAQ